MIRGGKQQLATGLVLAAEVILFLGLIGFQDVSFLPGSYNRSLQLLFSRFIMVLPCDSWGLFPPSVFLFFLEEGGGGVGAAIFFNISSCFILKIGSVFLEMLQSCKS